MSKKWRVAIVVQRYGEEVAGGAELHARWLAEHLLPLADVHVITTCAVDYTTWADFYPPGDAELNDVIVHRFPVDAPRNWQRAKKQAGRFLFREHTLFDEFVWMKEQGPYSTPFFNHLQASYPHFDAFIFFTFLYATTFFGLPLVADKAILVPTAHDDPYLPLPLFRSLFHLPYAIVYNTVPEKNLVNRLIHNRNRQEIVAGIGINVPHDVSPQRFRQKYGIEDDFVLYLGRIHESKNVPELVDYFVRFRQQQDGPLKLLLLGKSHLTLPDHPDIVHLGFVSEADKFDALKAATAVIMPSLYESLSMLTLEAWLMERPALVNGRCHVLKYQCRQSNGGLYYTSYDEFESGLTRLLASPALRQQLGRQGRRFVLANYSWDIIIAKYQALLETMIGSPAKAGR